MLEGAYSRCIFPSRITISRKVLLRRSWSPATTGPPGPSAANYFAVDGPPGPSMAAMDGPL